MSESEDDYLEKQLKIVFVGECNTGKTCLVQRYCNDDFYRQYSPTSGIDFFLNRTVLHCRGDKGKNANNILNISLKIYDVGGKALDSNMLRQYIHGANIVVLVYDITNIKSFEALPAWLNCVNENANEALITLMGNKSDMEHQRAIRLDRTQGFCAQNNLNNYTVSARNGEGVSSSIHNLISQVLNVRLLHSNPLTILQRKLKPKVVPPVATNNKSTNNPKPTATKPVELKKVPKQTSVCNVQ